MIKQRGILPDDSILAHIPDIYAYSKSDKFHWLQKVLDGSFESSWKSLIQLRFPVLENNFIFNCNLKPENIENVPIKNKFWRDLLQSPYKEIALYGLIHCLKLKEKHYSIRNYMTKVSHILVIWSMEMVDLKQLMKYGVSLIAGLIASITLAWFQ